jgi:hypothetical protein
MANRKGALSRPFISHSSANNAAAIALSKWLSEQGFDDVFLDIDPDSGGLLPGERWQEALKAAADRCQAVLVLVSPAWLDSMLTEFIPEPFERTEPVLTSQYSKCRRVDWMAGGGYHLISVGVPVAYVRRERSNHTATA